MPGLGNPAKISAHNQLSGHVLEMHEGATTSHVIIKVAGVEIYKGVKLTDEGANLQPYTFFVGPSSSVSLAFLCSSPSTLLAIAASNHGR